MSMQKTRRRIVAMRNGHWRYDMAFIRWRRSLQIQWVPLPKALKE